MDSALIYTRENPKAEDLKCTPGYRKTFAKVV